jgi:hypothetical protein
MKISILSLALMLSSLSTWCQSNEAISKLNELKISLTDITLYLQPPSKDYSFEMQVETPDPQYPVTYKSTYNPMQTPAWTMTSWNGKQPEKWAKRVLEDRAKQMATAPVTVDESTVKLSEAGDYWVVSFRVNAASLPKLYMYIKDCDGKAFINKTSGQLEKTEWANFQPTKNGVVKVKKIHEVSTYKFAEGIYQVDKVTQAMNGSVDTKVGEKGGEANQIITFSNYRKVK